MTSMDMALLDEASGLLKVLSHPVRLRICCELRAQEFSVSALENLLSVKQSHLSRELAKLREEGLVETRRESKVVFYRLSEHPRIRPMVDAICAVMRGDFTLSSNPGVQSVQPSLRPNKAGGYGVFARTAPPTPQGGSYDEA